MNARGKLCKTMQHEMLLPHEVVGSFFKREDLWRTLIGGPGETWNVSCHVISDAPSKLCRSDLEIILQPRPCEGIGKASETSRMISSSATPSWRPLQVIDLWKSPCRPAGLNAISHDLAGSGLRLRHPFASVWRRCRCLPCLSYSNL